MPNNTEKPLAGDDQHTPMSFKPTPTPRTLNMQTQDNQLECAAASNVKMPNFLPKSTHLWFAQVESKFRLFNIRSDQQKYDYVLSSIDEPTLQDLYDLVIEPPAADRYATIKDRVIRANEEDDAIKLHRLLKGIPLGDMKPSRLLQQMRLLAKGRLLDSALEQLWLDQLPGNVKVFLLGSDKTLKEKAEAADKMCDGTATISEVRSNPDINSVLENLSLKVDKLCMKITQVEENARGRTRERTPTRERDRSRFRSRNNIPWRDHIANGMCWYHEVHGQNANKCMQGCRYAPKN